MKICIFSDVHGNSIAWQNMYRKEKENVDQFFFLGDLFGYFYDQSIIIKDFMADDRIVAIKGNHDKYYLKYFSNMTGAELKEVDEVVDYPEDIWSELVKKYGCSYRQKVEPGYKAYLRNLPDSRILEIDGKRIGLFHGGPEDYLEQQIYPDTEIHSSGVFDLYASFDYIFTGHTHYRMDRKKDDCRIINPGSLGQPRDGKGFSYIIFDSVSGEVEYREVQSEIETLIKEAQILDGDTDMYQYLIQKYTF